MARLEVVPFSDEHLDDAGRLLAARHARQRKAEPLLPERFEDPVEARFEVEAAWRWTESILDAWEARGDTVKPYIAGTWGPSQSVALIERDGRTWHDDTMSNG